MKKKFLLPLLALLALPATAATTGENFTYEGIVYTVLSSEEKTASTVEGSSRDYYSENSYLAGDVVIPEIVMDEEGNKYTVTEIADISFSAGDLTSITIPKTVVNIGYLAFAYCDYLVTIYNYSGYPQLSYYDGYGYSLSDNYAFYETPTENITVYVAENAISSFYGWGGYNWKAIEPIEGYNIDYPPLEEGERFVYNGISYEVVNSTELTCITAANLWTGYDYPQDTNLSGNIVIPSEVEVNGNSYTVIGVGEGSFLYAGYNSRNGFSLTLPETIEFIGDEAFENAKLTSIEIDATSLTSLGTYAFYQNTSLKSVVFTGEIGEDMVLTFEGDMTNIGHQFQKCTNLQTLVLPTSLVNIPYRCLDDCTALGPELIIPRNVKEIGQYGIRNCNSLQTLILPASLQTFTKNGIRSAEMLENLYEFSTTPPVLNNVGIAFGSSYVNSKNVNLFVPRQGVEAYKTSSDTEWNELGWKSIQEISFEEELYNYVVLNNTEASLENADLESNTISLVIPTKVELYSNIFNITEIGAGAFVNTEVTDLTIPSNIAVIGEGAFNGENIESVTMESTVPPTAVGAFTNLNPNAVLYVPAVALEAYREAGAPWSSFYRIRPVGYEAPDVENNFTLAPANNTSVESLTTITVSSELFTNLQGVGTTINVNEAEATVTSENVDGELIITLNQPLDQMGDYNIVIPAGFFTYMEDIYTEDSPELTLNINIAAKVVNVSFAFSDSDALDFLTSVELAGEPVTDWTQGFNAAQTQELTLTFDMALDVTDVTLNNVSILENIKVTDNVGVYTIEVGTEDLEFYFNVTNYPVYATVNVSFTFTDEKVADFVTSVKLDNAVVENWANGFEAVEGEELALNMNMDLEGYIVENVLLNGNSILSDISNGTFIKTVGTENLAFSFTIVIDPTSGIKGLNAETLENAEIYTINGTRIANKNLVPGIYIVRQGNKTSKIIVR